MELWLKALRNDVRKEITIQAFDATLPEIVSTAVTPWHRKVSLEPLDVVIQHAMKTFDSRPDESDRWLAPRVHSALRLFRSEAATQGIWDFLSVVAFPDYVKWRWIKDGKGDIRRVLGPDHRHAIARLWWAAELTRNGDDYKGTVNAFTSQTAVQHILELRAFCSRPATLGFVEFVASSRSGSWASDREIPRYVNALNYALSTTVLDVRVVTL